jgi:hypothetical protein
MANWIMKSFNTLLKYQLQSEQGMKYSPALKLLAWAFRKKKATCTNFFKIQDRGQGLPDFYK